MSESFDLPSQPAVPALPVLPASLSNFVYNAQTEHGLRLNGSIEAPDHPTAVRILEGLRLRVLEVVIDKPRVSKPSRGDEFRCFNERLAQLTKSGLPIEEGLRLIAADMRRGRFANAIAKIAAEIKGGVSATTAFEKHRHLFPRLYGKLIESAAGGENLPGILLNLGRHLELQQRLAGALWRSVAYPAATLCGLLLVVSGIGFFVMPRFVEMFDGYHEPVPLMMDAVIRFGEMAPWLAAGLGAFVALFMMVRTLFRAFGAEAVATERLLLPLPLVGPVLRFNLIARWLDMVRIGIAAGANFPAAVALAGDCTRSPQLRRDGARLASAFAAGIPLADIETALLPATVPMTIDYATQHHDLSTALQTLCDLYERQAELRLKRVPAILTPILVILISVVICFVISGIVIPLGTIIQSLLRFIRW